MSDNSVGMLADLVVLLREKAETAKRQSASGGDYEKGKHFAYFDALSLIHQQALAFDLPLAQLGLTNFNPERDVL